MPTNVTTNGVSRCPCTERSLKHTPVIFNTAAPAWTMAWHHADETRGVVLNREMSRPPQWAVLYSRPARKRPNAIWLTSVEKPVWWGLILLHKWVCTVWLRAWLINIAPAQQLNAAEQLWGHPTLLGSAEMTQKEKRVLFSTDKENV